MKRPTPLGSEYLTDDIKQTALLMAVIMKKAATWPYRLNLAVNQPAVSEHCLCSEVKEAV